ncbi:MAG: DMT family transporter [Acidimicrobiia bacterium]
MSIDRVVSNTRAVWTALFVTFLWSSSWVLIRWGLDEEALEPITFAALRYALAAIVLLAWVVSQPRLRKGFTTLNRSSIAQLVVLGIVLYALTQGAQFVAIDNQPAATTSLVLSWTPLLVALVGGWSIAETSSPRQLAGTLMVVAGAWFYFAGDLGSTAVGMTAALVGLAANVASALLGRHVNRRADLAPVVIAASSMAVGAALLVTAGIIVEGPPVISARAWLIIGWLAVVNTALAFTLWNLSLRRLSALESAAINNTMLIQIAILAWVFLDESLGLGEAAGIVLVSVGILLTQTVMSSRSRRPGVEQAQSR